MVNGEEYLPDVLRGRLVALVDRNTSPHELSAIVYHLFVLKLYSFNQFLCKRTKREERRMEELEWTRRSGGRERDSGRE